MILQMLPWNMAIYYTKGWLMREKAGNPIGPPSSNIAVPTFGGPNSNILLGFDVALAST